MRVVVSAPYMIPVLDRFRQRLEAHGLELVVPPVSERLSEAELLRWAPDADGFICGDDCFTERVLANAPRLKVISKWGTGIDSIDQQACARRGIRVGNTPNAFTSSVADTVLGYVLCFARGLPWLDRACKGGAWQKLPGRSLAECSLGVIGVGNIGRAVVERAAAFGMRVLGNDVLEIPPEFRERTGLEVLELPELLSEADFISVNCDLNPTSHHLIDAGALAGMGPATVLINTARGPIVDEKALVAALQEGAIAGAALDVFEDEPLPAESPLRSMENVMISPHNANSSPEAWERVHENTIRNLLAGLGIEQR